MIYSPIYSTTTTFFLFSLFLYFFDMYFNPLVPGVQQKVAHTLFKYKRPFSGHQTLKG